MITEVNWFFRLSRYEDAVASLIDLGRLRIEPAERRNEALAFLGQGLRDFSVSRPSERARGWGIPVPDDPSQVVYVWFDALANYITALDYASGSNVHQRWWHDSAERVHVIGKGIIRFHAVYWPAILLSAREPRPTAILVHDYVTVAGEKLSKSLGNAVDPFRLVGKYGADAVRWWFVRDFPLGRDADFREELLVARANELADDLGNLINRTIALVSRYRPDGIRPAEQHPTDAAVLRALKSGLSPRIDEALAVSDLRGASGALWNVVAGANSLVSKARPWELARLELSGDAGAGQRLDSILGVLVEACHAVARELQPLLPAAASRIDAALSEWDVERGRTLFAKFGAS